MITVRHGRIRNEQGGKEHKKTDGAEKKDESSAFQHNDPNGMSVDHTSGYFLAVCRTV